MTDDNTNNLPILDDIIKPGESDKAVVQPSSKVQSSLRPADETTAPSTASVLADIDSQAAIDPRADIDGLTRGARSAPDAVDPADLEALTEKILGDMMPGLELLLRAKIRQALKNHISGETGSD